MASDSDANKSPTLATDDLSFFETPASDNATVASASNDDELKFFGKPKQNPSVAQLASTNKSGSTANLLVDFDGAKSNANAGAPPAADTSSDASKGNISLLDDTPLNS